MGTSLAAFVHAPIPEPVAESQTTIWNLTAYRYS